MNGVLCRQCLIGAIVIIAVMTGRVDCAVAQWTDSFESPAPSWWLLTQSKDVQLRRTQRVFQNAIDDQGFEQIELQSTGKVPVQVACRVSPMMLIDELKVRLWVKSSRVGAVLGVRVVLPHTARSQTGERLSVVVVGDGVQEINRWTELSLDRIASRLDKQLPALRKALGQRIDTSEAYVDLVVVEDAVGAGNVRIGVDGLAIDGIVFAADQPKRERTESAPKSFNSNKRASEESAAAPVVKAAAGLFEINGKPFFVRAIEWNGESLESLKSLGFNTVKLRQPPSQKLDQEALKLGLWLIAPPAFDPDAAERQRTFKSVIAWDMGEDLGAGELDTARKYIGQSRGAAREEVVFVGGAESHLWEWSRVIDVPYLDAKGIFASGELSRLGRDVRRLRGMGRPGAPAWVVVHTQPASALAEQIDAFRPGQSARLAVSPQQLLMQAHQAIVGGVRGLIFKSRGRLDAKRPDAELRSASLKWVNLQLDLIAPFAAMADATILGEVEGDTTIGSLGADRSMLLVLLNGGKQEQFEPSGIFHKSTAVLLRGGRSPRMQLTWRGVRQLGNAARDSGRMLVERSSAIDYVISSEDSAAIEFAMGITEQNRSELAATQLQVASLWHAHSASGLQAGGSQPNAGLADANATLSRSAQLLQRGDEFGSLLASEETLRQIAAIRRNRWSATAAKLPSALVSPLCVSADLLDLNAELGALIANQRWSANKLEGWDLESLETLQNASWLAYQSREAGIETSLAIGDQAAHTGKGYLALRASTPAPSRNDVDAASVAMTTAEIAVRKGDLVRYSLWARSGNAGETASQLEIFDSLGGRDLGLRLETTPTWTNLVFYRFAPEDGHAVLTAALLGVGQIDLDSIEVQTLSPTKGIAAVGSDSPPP